MIENIYEQSVINENTLKSQSKYILIGGLSVLSFCIAFFGLVGFSSVTDSFSLPMIVVVVFGIVLGVFLWRKKDEAYLEYEYAYTCGDFEVAKIINSKRRKTLCKFSCADIETFGKISASNYKRYLNMPDAKKLYATFNKKSENVYFAFYTGKKGKVVLHFEPDEEMLRYIKKHLKVQISL